MYRKMMAILLAAGLALGMTACGQKTSGEGFRGKTSPQKTKSRRYCTYGITGTVSYSKIFCRRW